MSGPDPDAVERDALAEDLHGDCYEGLDPAAKREVDQLLAAGWSRSPRPAAVSEEVVRIIGHLRQMIEDSNDARYETLSTAVVSSALEDLTAALPYLATVVAEHRVSRISQECYCDCGQSVGDWWEGFPRHVAEVQVAVLTAALPHLAPGQSEVEVRADERAKVAERIEAEMDAAWAIEQGKRGFRHGLRRAAHIARTAPAKDGAE